MCQKAAEKYGAWIRFERWQSENWEFVARFFLFLRRASQLNPPFAWAIVGIPLACKLLPPLIDRNRTNDRSVK
jgi:hypothetical protein